MSFILDIFAALTVITILGDTYDELKLQLAAVSCLLLVLKFLKPVFSQSAYTYHPSVVSHVQVILLPSGL